MKQYQIQFLDYVTSHGILTFGEFSLKSGRKSPYFFNAGLFCSGQSLGFMATSYAAAIVESGLEFDVIFGPAYKGIPLASSAAVALSRETGIDKPYCFNRKEAKDHGEGGSIVGAPLQGRVLIVDDVITAGTAVREVMDMIEGAGAEAVGIVVALDRQEKGRGELSAIQEIEADYGIPVLSIISLQQIMEYLEDRKDAAYREFLPALQDYRAHYGVT